MFHRYVTFSVLLPDTVASTFAGLNKTKHNKTKKPVTKACPRVLHVHFSSEESMQVWESQNDFFPKGKKREGRCSSPIAPPFCLSGSVRNAPLSPHAHQAHLQLSIFLSVISPLHWKLPFVCGCVSPTYPRPGFHRAAFCKQSASYLHRSSHLLMFTSSPNGK